ncbi:MAG: hypothetical protein ACXVZL_05380 [Gaiellaceae bacterium]
MHPDIMLLLATERQAELRREAAASRLAREARTAARASAPPTRPDVQVTLRLDTVGDVPRLYQLAALEQRPLADGPFVVAEVEGRAVAVLPVAGGAPLADPFEPTAHLLPLLELRAAQIRRADERPLRRLRLLPRRA